MGFVKIVMPFVNKAHIVACKVHVQSNVRMMRRIIIQQRNKQTNYISNTKQSKQRPINIFRKESVQDKKSLRKITMYAATTVIILFIKKTKTISSRWS